METKTSKRLASLESKVDKVTDLLAGDLEKLRKDSAELAQIKELVSHVKLSLRDVRVVENDTGSVSVVVVYEPPRIVLTLDENGEPQKDEFFYSTNRLNMISSDAAAKILSTLDHARSKIKKR